MAKDDVSLLSYTPTDLSRRTEVTAVSVPEDGRVVTLHTNRRARRSGDDASTTATSQTSLLIEYFERPKAADGVPSNRPSVRVKLTPGTNKRSSHVSSRDRTEIGVNDTSTKGRRGSVSSRQQVQIPKGEDRLTLGEDRIDGGYHARSFSGDLSSNLSMEDDDSRAPLNFTIYQEDESIHSSPGHYNEGTDITIRTKHRRSTSKSHRDTFGHDKLSPKLAKRDRSRSASREESNLRNQERVSSRIRKKIEELGTDTPIKSKNKNGDDNLKPAAGRRKRSRSRSRDLKAGKKSDAVSKLSDNTQYPPALLEAVEDTIKRLILPQLQDLKVSQNRTKFDQAIAAVSKITPQKLLAAHDDSRGLKSISMPDVTKPLVVLTPDADQGQGQAFVVSEAQDHPTAEAKDEKTANAADDNSLISDHSYSRAPGLGPTLTATGESMHSIHSDKGEGVLLEPVPEVAPEDRLKMPPMPTIDYADSIQTRASILTEQDGLPYPLSGDSGPMPASGNTPPRSRASSIGSLESINGHRILREPESTLAPSTYLDDHDDRPGSSSSMDSGSRVSLRSVQQVIAARAKPVVVKSPSQLSIPSISDTPSTKIARQRRKGKERDNSIGEEDEDDDKEYAESGLSNGAATPLAKTSADWFTKQRELAQQQALLDSNRQRADIEVQMSVHDDKSFENMQTEKTLPPFLSANNAIPNHNDPLPDVNGMRPDDDDLTNPSILQESELDHNWDDHLASRDIDMDGKLMTTTSPLSKDEGYASPGFTSPGPSALQMGGIDDMLEGDDFTSLQRARHNRVGSGGSHGMSSPLYDSATGRGVDRIQSKDIVALMDHLTVRDAQRNARDTEILITLVRSAAEMRNSYEDLKKQLEQAKNEIVQQVDVNTERTVNRALIGPRPQPVSAPRPPRMKSLASEGGAAHDEEEAGKRKSMFKRALKGLSMRSANDLTKIEQMLERLLDEVEGLKGGNEFYQQSILGTIENLKNTPPHTGLGLDAPSSSTATSGYYTNTNPSNGSARQSGPIKIYDEMRSHTSHRISPIEENAATPTPQPQPRSAPVDTPPPQQSLQSIPVIANSVGTPKTDKAGGKRESGSSMFPKISRWSETTTSSGVRGFLRKGRPGKESEASMSNSEFDFWAESGHAGQPPEQFAETPLPPTEVQSPVPPSSRGTDVPVNQATIRSSLEVKHPQPKQVYRHQLEQQAQQFINMEPSLNNTTSSLARYTSQDGTMMPTSPTSEAYSASMADSAGVLRPAKIPEEYEGSSSPTPLKEKKSKERNKDKTHRKERADKHVEKDKETRRRERQERRERRERREREKENGGDRSQRSSKSKLTEDTGAYMASDVDQVRPLFHKQSKESALAGEEGVSTQQYDYKNMYTDYDDSRSSPEVEGKGQSRDIFGNHDDGKQQEEVFGKSDSYSYSYDNHNHGSNRVWFR